MYTKESIETFLKNREELYYELCSRDTRRG